METGKLEKILTSDPYQQFPNSPNYINQDYDTKYYDEKTNYDDVSNYDEFYFDYADYYPDNIPPYYDDERITRNNTSPPEILNDRNDQADQEEIKYPKETDDMEIKYSQSYSKMNLANKLSGDTEVLNIGPISNNVINNSINQTEKSLKSKPVKVTPGPNIS